MRWPWRRKPEPPDDDRDFLRAIGWIDDDGQPIPSPERAKPETPRARRPWDAVPLHELIGPLLADATETIPNPYAQETTMTTPDPFPGITPHSTIEALAGKLHGTGLTARIGTKGTRPEGGPSVITIDADEPQPAWEMNLLDAARVIAGGNEENRLVTTDDGMNIAVLAERYYLDQMRRLMRPAEPEVGSAAWLRDLADRLQQHIADRCALPDEVAAATSTFSPDLIRRHADDVERDERQAAADTRERERVEQILAARWAKDRDRQFLPSLVPTWDDLTDEERAHCIDYGLELYRAGRDDQEADRG